MPLGRDGYELVTRVVPTPLIDELYDALADAPYVERDLFSRYPSIRRLPALPGLDPFLGKDCFAVRALFFDKRPGKNWPVAWHQDRTIAVRERIDADGFGPWSVKHGVDHVEAPPEVLKSMVSIRFHLDDCDETNGPLRVVPGSHRHGALSAEQADALRHTTGEITVTAPRGSALLMRPLLLHASSPATTPGHRRVVHIEFAHQRLPSGLLWWETHDREM